MVEVPTGFEGAGLFPIARQAQSKTIHSNGRTITRATLSCRETFVEGDSAVYELSANGGNSWETVENGVEHSFTNRGTDLRFKVTLVGIGSSNTYVNALKVTIVES